MAHVKVDGLHIGFDGVHIELDVEGIVFDAGRVRVDGIPANFA